MNKILKRLFTGVLTLATVFTALPTTAVHAAETQYWTASEERVGIVEKVMNDGSIGSTFNEGHMTVEGEDAYCIDINTGFKNGYKTRADASTRMTVDQIADVALSLEYVKQYTKSHTGLNSQHAYLLRQLVVWQRLSVHLGWSCDNVRASYDEISKSVQDEVFAGAKAFVAANKGRYDCYGYIYTGEGQDLGQFYAKLAVGNGKIQKSSSNTTVTNGNNCYSLSGATYGVYSDKGCTKSVVTLTTNASGNTDTVELRAATYYVKETKTPKGFQLDKNVYTMTVKAGETSTLKVSDTPKVTDTLVELFKIDMETSKATPQGNASLEGAEFVWKYYDGYYTKDNLPSEPTRTWTTKTIAEKDSNNEVHYITRLADSYKVLGDSFYTQNGTICLPLGTITVEEKTAPNGYLLEGAYMQAAGSSEQIKGVYVAQITEDGELAALSGSNQYSVSDKVIRGGVKIQKRDLETKDTKAQGGATLKDTAFEIISLNDNAVLVDGKLYSKNEVVKTIHTGVDGIAATATDTLPYGKYRIEESNAPEGYLTDGAKPIEFEITEDGKIVDLTDETHSIYNQIKRGDLEGVKIGDGTHKRLANVPFRITSKTTGESHIIVTDKNGQFSTSSDWVSHKQNTNAGKTSEDGIWFGTSTPDDSKGALLYDTYTIEELRCVSNKGMTLIPAFDVVVSRNNVVIDLGTLTDDYEPEISIHTTATDKVTGEKSIVAGKNVTIVDTVTLDGLTKGTKYQLKGWQMVKSENAQLLIDGQPVESNYTFTAKKSEMEVEVSYTFNASALGGKDLVTFEELYDLSNPDEPIKVAEHKDIEDEGQTVTIEERVIEIHTNAVDKATGEKMIVAGKEVKEIKVIVNGGDMLPKQCDRHSEQSFFINGFLDEYFEELKKQDITYLAMLGNDDLLAADEMFDNLCDRFENVCNIAGRKFSVNGYEFIGMNYILDHPFGCKDRVVTETHYIPQRQLSPVAGISNAVDYDRIYNWLEYSRTELPHMCDVLKKLPLPDDRQKAVYVMHMPPAGLRLGQLRYQDLDIGSVDIYEFLKEKQPLLSLHGHIHESPDTEKGKWINQIHQTTCIQTGQTELNDSHMVYAEIDLQEKKYERKVISVD